MAQSTYTQYYSNFIGADMSSDARVVARNRLARSVNMWRDYESEQGAAVETFPGFRKCAKIKFFDGEGNPINPNNNIWFYKGKTHRHIILNQAPYVFAYTVDELKDARGIITDDYENDHPHAIFGKGKDDAITEDATAFFTNNRLFIFCKRGIVSFYEDDEGKLKADKITDFYKPTTYYNGKPYEQRNALSNTVIDKYQNGGTETVFKNGEGDNAENVNVISFNINDNIIGMQFPVDVYRTITSVKVAGVEYSHPKLGENDSFFRFSKENGKFKNEYIVLHSGRENQKYGFESYATSIIIPKEKISGQLVEITYNVEPTHFNTIGNLVHFQSDKVTMAEAILGCTKSAVYDGRVFLTGNPALPNTVFYSHRNLTGANDPTYFGVYNYFNDGEGNTPNVDMLAMPNMLMVMKSDTVQDGSVYYHVGLDNPHSDESVRNLLPRIYPATKGAAGLGSAGDTTANTVACNFLDNPVFLSQRGLEATGKEDIRLERVMVHRSSNVDRLLRKEDLAHASLAEWKGYLVICCNGHIYLADSRTMAQHPDGSVQYEWFYLEGVGTYQDYGRVYHQMTVWPEIDGVSLQKILSDNGIQCSLFDSEGVIYEHEVGDSSKDLGYIETKTIGNIAIYMFVDYEKFTRRLVDLRYDESCGKGAFYGAKRVLAVGDLLFFATDHDICLFNTDKRGVPITDDEGKIVREVDDDKIDYSWYSFGGVAYKSACALKLDDCDKKSLTKTTLYGTTVARFKMIPGGRCRIKASPNGRDWQELGEAFNTRQSFENFQFDNLSFAENEDNDMVIPEVSRGWVYKQYQFESGGFCEPFGLYELSYIYKIAGKIRYV